MSFNESFNQPTGQTTVEVIGFGRRLAKMQPPD